MNKIAAFSSMVLAIGLMGGWSLEASATSDSSLLRLSKAWIMKDEIQLLMEEVDQHSGYLVNLKIHKHKLANIDMMSYGHPQTDLKTLHDLRLAFDALPDSGFAESLMVHSKPEEIFGESRSYRERLAENESAAGVRIRKRLRIWLSWALQSNCEFILSSGV